MPPTLLGSLVQCQSSERGNGDTASNSLVSLPFPPPSRPEKGWIFPLLSCMMLSFSLGQQAFWVSCSSEGHRIYGTVGLLCISVIQAWSLII